MAKSDDKISSENVNNNNTKHNISINMCEVERAFKRLKVDDSLNKINNKLIVNKLSDNCFDFSLKYCSNSMRKSSNQDKKHSLNAFRRRIPTLSSVKEKNNSCLDCKKKTIEDNYEFGAKSTNICKDFSQMNVKTNNTSNEFSFDLKTLSLSEWRTSGDNNCNKNDNHVNKCVVKEEKTCARQALCDPTSDASVDELAAYFDDNLYLPRKMSFMAEMMYT